MKKILYLWGKENLSDSEFLIRNQCGHMQAVHIFQILNKKNSIILYSAKVTFRNEKGIKTFWTKKI